MPRGGKREGAGRRAGAPTARALAIREAIDYAAKKAVKKSRHVAAHLTAADTLEQIRRGCQFDIRALFDEQGNLKPLHTLTAAEAMPIAGFEIIIKNAEAGDGHTDRVAKVKLIDRSRYVEMAAKHHGLLIEKLEVTGELSLMEKVARARQRLTAAKS